MADKVTAKSGDTLSAIAKANNTTTEALLAANPTLAARQAAGTPILFSGTKVTIPAAATSRTSAPVAGTEVPGFTPPMTTTPTVSADTMFTGPIPVGSTRTATGYTNADGTVVNPTGATVETQEGQNPPAPAGKKAIGTNYMGSGANRVLRTTFDDGSFQDSPAPEEAAGLTADAVNKLITDAISGQNAQFQKLLTDQKAALEQAKTDALAKERKSAFDIIAERFTAMGVPEFGKTIADIFKGEAVDRNGKKFDEIPTSNEGFYLQLTQTTPYYERFGSVNEARIKEGYRALDEKTIVGMEDEYQKVLAANNMPAGFYDQNSDYKMFLKNNFTTADLANTLQAYRDFTTSTNPIIRDQLKTQFGIDDAALTAYFADPAKGQSILESIAGKNLNTAAALVEGLTKETADLGQQYGAGNLSYAQQRQKYSTVQKTIQTTTPLANIYGENFGAEQAVAAEFGQDAQAMTQIARIQAINAANFGGTSGLGSKALRTKSI